MYWGNSYEPHDADALSLIGTDEADYLVGDDNNDYISGGAGNDIIYAKYGDDLVLGGDGDDEISGGLGYDEIHGGDGDDRIITYDRAYTREGDDGGYVTGGNGNDYIDGTYSYWNDLHGDAGNDTILGGRAGDSLLFGGSGDDILQAKGALTFMNGGEGSDRFVVSTGQSITIDDLDAADVIDLTQVKYYSFTFEDIVAHAESFTTPQGEGTWLHYDEINLNIFINNVTTDQLGAWMFAL